MPAKCFLIDRPELYAPQILSTRDFGAPFTLGVAIILKAATRSWQYPLSAPIVEGGSPRCLDLKV